MSSEERVVRPYVGLERVGNALKNTFLTLTNQHRVDPDQSKRLTPTEFLSLPVHLWFAPDEEALAVLHQEFQEGLAESQTAPDEAELLVMISTPRLKLAETVYRLSLSELDKLPPHVDLTEGTRPAPLRTPFGGCRIDAYVVLSRSLDEAPLRPWRKGTWLSRATFELKTDLGAVGFVPLPLTDEERERLQLPSGTIRYASVEDPFADTGAAEAIELYVDDELLNQLALRPSLAGAKAFQRQLFLDAMAALIHAASRHPEMAHKTVQDLEGTLLGRLIERLAGPRSAHTEQERRQICDRLLTAAKDDPSRALGWVEERIPGLRSGLMDVLRGEAT